MRTGTTHDFPAWLERLRLRFERWRQTRDGRSRIPEALWASAVKAAGKYGLNPTARTLGLDYYSLKKRAEAFRREFLGRATGSRGGSDGRPVATFVELPPPVPACSPECILELEHPGGAKMRVHLTGMQAPDLAVLSRSFWSMEVRHGESRRRRT